MASRSGPPPAVLLLVVLHAFVLAAWSLLYPPYLGYDEPQHVDMVVALQAGDGWAGPGERTQSLGVATSSDPYYGAGEVEALEPPYTGEQFPPRGERPSLEELGGNAPSSGLLPNQLVEHPPLAYALGAGLLELVPGSESLPYDRTVGLLRLLDVLLVAPLPLLAWAATRRLTGDETVALAAAPLVLAVPGLTRVSAMWTNDALLVVTAGAVLVLLTRVLTGDTSRRTGLLLGVALAAALLTKAFALLLVPLVLAAYAWALRTRSRAEVLRGAVPVVALASVAALWWVRNLVLYGSVRPSGFGAEVSRQLAGEAAPAELERSVLTWVRLFADPMTTRFWGGLGVPDAPTFSTAAAAAFTLVVVVAAGAALVGALRGQGLPPGRAVPIVVLGAYPLLLLAAAAYSSWTSYSHNLRVPSPQGRYLYAAAVGLAALVAAGLAVLAGRHRRFLPLVTLVAAALMQLRGVGLVLGEMWGAERLADLPDAGSRLLAVSPWPEPVTLVPFVVTPVLVGVVGWAFWRCVKSPQPDAARSLASAP